MNNDWILDVLTDLKAFAERNGLCVLAERLDEVRSLAAVEISSLPGAGETASGCAETGAAAPAPRKLRPAQPLRR